MGVPFCLCWCGILFPDAIVCVQLAENRSGDCLMFIHGGVETSTVGWKGGTRLELKTEI